MGMGMAISVGLMHVCLHPPQTSPRTTVPYRTKGGKVDSGPKRCGSFHCTAMNTEPQTTSVKVSKTFCSGSKFKVRLMFMGMAEVMRKLSS